MGYETFSANTLVKKLYQNTRFFISNNIYLVRLEFCAILSFSHKISWLFTHRVKKPFHAFIHFFFILKQYCINLEMLPISWGRSYETQPHGYCMTTAATEQQPTRQNPTFSIKRANRQQSSSNKQDSNRINPVSNPKTNAQIQSP